MVQTPPPKAAPLSIVSSSKNGWLVFLFISVLMALGIGSYLFLSRQASSAEEYHASLKEIQAARAEIQTLRQQLEQRNSSAQIAQMALANKEVLGKISDNFQKIFIFSKLERRVLTGQNFSSSFSKLENLIGVPFPSPQFDVLRNNTPGITLPADIETSFRSYSPPHQSRADTLGEKIFYFFNSFFKIRTFQEKEKIDTLCALIRNDHNKKALNFIEKNLPEYREWGQALKNRLEAKKALKALEQIVFDSLRI